VSARDVLRLMFFVTRRTEKHRLEKEIERLRLASRFAWRGGRLTRALAIQIWLDRHPATAAILFSDDECVVSAEPLARGSMGRGAGVAEEDYVGINMGAGNPERLTVR
jgi:hypothetical protein